MRRTVLSCATVSIVFFASAQALATISIDFRYDWDTDFFDDPTRRDLLDDAAEMIADVLNDDLAAIPAATAEGVWQAIYRRPSDGASFPDATLAIPEKTLVVFVAGRDLDASTLALTFIGNVRTFDINEPSFNELVMYRGQTAAPDHDFGPWGGSISFNNNANWGFAGPEAEPEIGRIDFLSVALHEIGHILGSGTAPSWSAMVTDERFSGSNAQATFGGNVPVTSDGLHWASGTSSLTNGIVQNASLTPNLSPGQRNLFTDLDFAALQDIGWVVVPEPSSALVLTGAALLLLQARRRGEQRTRGEVSRRGVDHRRNVR